MKVMCITPNNRWKSAAGKIPINGPEFEKVYNVVKEHESKGEVFYELAEFPSTNGCLELFWSKFFVPLSDEATEVNKESHIASNR